MNSESYSEWEKLCKKHDIARDAHYKALGAVTRKFSAIARLTSQENPSEHELTTFEQTGQDWEDIKNEMARFVKKHASN